MNTNQDHASMLREMLRDHEERLDRARATVQQEEPVVASLKAAIAALDPNAPKDRRTLVAVGAGGIMDATPPMPERMPGFTDLTHAEAAKLALTQLCKAGETRHVDAIITAIYGTIPNADLFYRVKRTLVSEILRNMKKGMFVRGPKPNTFGLPKEERKMAS